MGWFFGQDSAFVRIGNLIADIFILSVLWIAFSIPLVTIGASTTALFYVTTRRVSDKEGYLFRDFCKSFRANFFQATVVWMILIAVTALLILNIFIIQEFETLRLFLVPLYGFLLIELFFISIYIFPLISRFHVSVKEAFRSSFFIAHRHLLTTAACVMTMAAVLFLIIFVLSILVLVAVGLYAFSVSALLIRVFRKYRPEIDEDDFAYKRETTED